MPNQRCHFKSIHVRHLRIQQDQAIGMSGSLGRVHLLQSLLSVLGFVRFHVPAGKRLTQDGPIGRIVIDDQGGKIAKHLQVDRGRLVSWLGLPAKRHAEMKCAALAGMAFDQQFARHQPHQPGRDRETEAGAAIFSRHRVVGLGEGLKDHLLFRCGNPGTGIDHAEVQDRSACRV